MKKVPKTKKTFKNKRKKLLSLNCNKPKPTPRVPPQTIKKPTVNETKLGTDVTLEDDGYVILGGLIINRHENVEKKFPGLWRIPVIGKALFRSQSLQKTTSNLIIILEAQIVSPRGRAYEKGPLERKVGDTAPGGRWMIPVEEPVLPGTKRRREAQAARRLEMASRR